MQETKANKLIANYGGQIKTNIDKHAYTCAHTRNKSNNNNEKNR